MKIGTLTGGGDVPGLNACIKAVTMRAGDDPASLANNLVDLDPGAVRTIDRTGGTILHTSRTNPARVRPSEEPEFLAEGREDDQPRDHTKHVLGVIDRLGIDALVPIGGDDTLSFALRLHDEGVPVVAIPKTMDNDVHGTDYCIGFSTAITRTVIFIHQLRTSAGSHERLAVVMGGSADAYGHLKLGGIGEETGEALRKITGEGVICQQLGYLMRSGSPDSLDLMVAINYAVMAADLVIEGNFGRLVALRNGSYVNVPIGVVREREKRVDVEALYDVDQYRPKIRHVDGKPMFLY